MDESGVHFKFLFGPIYLFTYFLPTYLWVCLRVGKKHLQPKKGADVFLQGGLQNTAIYASPMPADLQ